MIVAKEFGGHHQQGCLNRKARICAVVLVQLNKEKVQFSDAFDSSSYMRGPIAISSATSLAKSLLSKHTVMPRISAWALI